MKCLITEVIQHSTAVKEFYLRREDGESLPSWQPGSHIILNFSGADGRAFENHYSLIGAPGQPDIYRIAVQREEGGKGGSRCLHDEMAVGSQVDVSGPFNSFPLASSGPRVLLIAGGIGITPMVSMAHALGELGSLSSCIIWRAIRSAWC